MGDLLEESFRKLRLAWFNHHLKRTAHERIWEDEEASMLRDKQNLELFEKYSSDTEDIIKGIRRPISPRCGYDLYEHK
jgi:hypothetical protein